MTSPSADLTLFVTPRIRAYLADPRDRSPLALREAADLPDLRPIAREGFEAPTFGKTDTLLAKSDGNRAYPIIDGYPALMWPDALVRPQAGAIADMYDRRYWEAYSEMAFYNPFALKNEKDLANSPSHKFLTKLLASAPSAEAFPEPHEQWLEPSYEIQAKRRAFQYLAPVKDKLFVQLGGEGREAIRFLMAGAAEAVHITPMIGEAIYGRALAKAFGVEDRLSSILAIGEELPFADGSIDILFSHACMHHMQLELALPEIRRVLVAGGKFAATDPWKAPLYALGTKIFGKREHGLFNRSQSVFCKPIDPQRLAPLASVFDRHVVSHHAPVLRYPLLALKKFGITLPDRLLFGVSRADDRLGQAMGASQTWGSSLMFGGQKSDQSRSGRL